MCGGAGKSCCENEDLDGCCTLFLEVDLGRGRAECVYIRYL